MRPAGKLATVGSSHVEPCTEPSQSKAPQWVETDTEWGMVSPESCHLHPLPQAGLSFLPALPTLLFQVVDA